MEILFLPPLELNQNEFIGANAGKQPIRNSADGRPLGAAPIGKFTGGWALAFHPFLLGSSSFSSMLMCSLLDLHKATESELNPQNSLGRQIDSIKRDYGVIKRRQAQSSDLKFTVEKIVTEIKDISNRSQPFNTTRKLKVHMCQKKNSFR